MKNFILAAVLLTHPAFALTEAEFRLRANGLYHKQKETDALMRRLGAPSHSDFVSPPPQKEEESKPLFRIHGELSSAHISTGKLLYGKIFTRLVVGPDGSPVLVILDDDQGSLSGIRIMGVAHQSGTEGRLVLELNKLLLKTGKTVTFQGTALDMDGAFGLQAEVFSGKVWSVGGAMVSSFVSGLAASQQTQTVNAFGFSAAEPTGRNSLLQGVAQTAADQSKRLVEEATQEKPILKLDSLTPVVVLVQEEVRF